ncbi:putative zinc-binding protein [Pseudothauera rhizosphaerae]|uniref:Zinc-binding protein n=1 Tax=Pseudothauera rhizosphaerae TaxID=2565932 RepID=A0A4S4AXA6_9RHOO|nr:putative zinc-binding protein [Pseudothauera rhizosphaerae]THF63242.1 zinc-binding protein [Pseudothauera rhizosphaerae]
MNPPTPRTIRPPLVYSCSGCSSAAQLANHLALELDTLGAAEMSCIAGVGGKVPALLKTAHSGRPILALDGCVLACVRETLATEGLVPAAHVRLDLLGVRKRRKARFDPAQAAALLPALARTAARLAGAASEPKPR